MSQDLQINEVPERIYYTQIQNIILELLDPMEFAIYAHLRKIAGEGGKCFYSMSNLSKKCKVSEPTLKKHLKSLSEKKYKEIGNKPFISLLYRKKENGDNDTPVITLTNIWSHNIKFYDETLPENGNKKLNDPGSKFEPPLGKNLTHPGQESYPPLGKIFAPNNNHAEEEPFKNKSSGRLNKNESNEDTPTPMPAAAASTNSEIIFYKGNNGELKSITRSDLHRHLVKFSLTPEMANKAIEKFSERKSPVGNPFRVIEFIVKDLIESNKPKVEYKQTFKTVGYEPIKNPVRFSKDHFKKNKGK